MNKFNMLFRCSLLVLAMVATSCNQDLQDDVNNLKDRVTALEETTKKLQEAIDNGKLITAVNPMAATSTDPAGWEILFSDNTKIPVYNGVKGDTGVTPYVWINSAGNWATNPGSKPSNSDNAMYEIKVNGSSVKANGTSVRTKNANGFIAFEEYDAVSGTVKNTVTTTIPFDHENYITSVVDNGESVTFTIDGKEYALPKADGFPMSITVIRDKEYVIKGGTVDFNIAVNPSTSKVYTKADFELDYEANYAYTRGIAPDFIKIKDVQPSTIKGQYTMTLEWAESNTKFAKDAAIFIILNFKAGDKPAKIMSATPVIMNEKYVRIAPENVLDVNDIYMFTDETFTDSVRLRNYHEGYVNTVGFTITPSTIDNPHKAVDDPFTRYLSASNKYKFTVVPVPASNATIWPDNVYSRVVDVKASVTDHGRPKVNKIDAKPEIGQPEIPEIPAIDPITINKDFKVTVFKVPVDGVIFKHDFEEFWIPNEEVNYSPSVALGGEFAKSGYLLANWNFAIKSQTLKKNGAAISMDKNITADVTKFNVDNNFTTSYKLLSTINEGSYVVEMVVTATPKVPRPTGSSKQEREFKVTMAFKVVAPIFQIKIRDGHTLIQDNSSTYYTNKLANVNVGDLFDVESNQNISKSTDVTPNTTPLSYKYDLTDPRHGAQGVRFNPYPAVIAPAISDWGSQMYIQKPIKVFVRLNTGQEIPVRVICTTDATTHSTGSITVQYDRLNLHHVASDKSSFYGSYNAMINTGINISFKDGVNSTSGNNFTPEASNDNALDPTMIKTTGGIVFSEVGTVHCDGGDLPSGLAGKSILTINPSTGVVTSVDGVTWENPDAVLYQTFRVTYTDIWNNQAYTDVNVYVKSNSVPIL